VQAQTWQRIKSAPSISGYNPTLMTDGTVLVQDGDNDDWWKLTPDSKGQYLTGKWTQLPSTPGYGPLYYASAVLPDGRLFTMGGEYNMGSGEIWSNLGYIYDPATNKWTFLPAPGGWTQIGDMGSITLPNGKLMVMDPFNSEGALFDPATNQFTAPYGTGKLDASDEEGLTLLPNGTILTVDTTPGHSEIFNPTTATWSSAGTTPVTLVGLGEEIGPQVLRYDGTVICFGGGNANAVYNTKTATWSTAPSFPTVGGNALCCADAPACLLTSGNVLVQCAPPNFGSGSVFLEFNGTTLNAVTAPPSAAGDPSFVGNMLMLPTGQVLVTDQSPDMELYNSVGTPDPSWFPAITTAPLAVSAGQSYLISGTQFNGLSGSSAYGDDEQNYTNFPLVRITNNKTGDMFYCKEFSPSTMAICTGTKIVSTNFLVPANIEQGASTIQVVTNGLASKAVAITVGPPVQSSGISVFTGTFVRGTLSSIWSVDGNAYQVRSVNTAQGQVAAIEADFILPSTSISSLTVNTTSTAIPGVTGMLYLYDWTAGAWVYLSPSYPLGSAAATFSASGTGTISRFVGPGGQVRALVRALMPPRTATGSFVLSADQIYVS
jgi:hypothetical protein